MRARFRLFALFAALLVSGCSTIPPLADGRSLLFLIEKERAEREAFDRQVVEAIRALQPKPVAPVAQKPEVEEATE